LSLAYSGRKADAISYGQKSLGDPAASSNFAVVYNRHQLTRIYTVFGDKEKALDNIDILLKVPSYLSPERLKIDPNFAPLRGNPRFERMTAGAVVTN
jgi:hypothetical protein